MKDSDKIHKIANRISELEKIVERAYDLAETADKCYGDYGSYYAVEEEYMYDLLDAIVEAGYEVKRERITREGTIRMGWE